jgi:hypothetical protein
MRVGNGLHLRFFVFSPSGLRPAQRLLGGNKMNDNHMSSGRIATADGFWLYRGTETDGTPDNAPHASQQQGGSGTASDSAETGVQPQASADR